MRAIERLAAFGADWRFLSRGARWTDTLPLTLREFAGLAFYHVPYLLLCYPLNQPVPTFQPRIALEVREFRRADLDQVRAVQRPSEANLCQERFERGHIGIVAYAQDAMAGHFWGCAQLDPALERINLPLGAGEVYMTDSFTFPMFRNNGVFTAMLLGCLRAYIERGFERAITCVDARSPVTPRVLMRNGFHEIGRFEYTRIGMWRHVRWFQMP